MIISFSRFGSRALACALGAVAFAFGAPAFAQESLLPSASWATAPGFSLWNFASPLSQSSGRVKSVSQIAIPIGARMSLGRATIDFRTGAAMSRATLESDDNGSQTFSLNGLSDIRVRASMPVMSDAVAVTAGVNIPTGSTGLDAEQSTVLQFISAPALALPVPTYGSGFGGTLGFVGAKEVGAWALALGASYEQRSEYTPIKISLDNGQSETKIDPGSAMHLTLGGDRVVGSGRLSVLFVADVFTKDAASTGSTADGFSATSYKLGPQLSAMVQTSLGLSGWRESGFGLSARRRSGFSDQNGDKVEGSDANYLEAGFIGVRGRAQGFGLVLGADARYHSGMEVTDALVGAALTAAGVTIGGEWPMSQLTARVTTHVQLGSFDTGASKSNANAVSIGMALSSRRGQ